MKKRVFSLVLSLIMILGSVSPAFALDENDPPEWQDGTFNDGVYEGYYAQLDELQKMLYDKIKEAFAEPTAEANIEFDEPILIETKAGDSFTEDDLYQWMCDNMFNDRGGRYAVFRDHPELPWLLAVEYVAIAHGDYVYDAQGVCTGFCMTGMYYENTYPWVPPEAYADPDALEDAVELAVAAIGEARPSRAATVRAIHDYLCELTTYEGRSETVPGKDGGAPHTVYYDQISYSALVSPHYSICNGYSAALKLLCDRYGIPCVHLSGRCFLPNGTEGNHAWNYVQLEDGNWYAIDPTWDDGQPIGYDHFLVGENTVNSAGLTFGDMHETPPYNNYLPASPTLSDTGYPYLEADLGYAAKQIQPNGSIQLSLSDITDLYGTVISGVSAGLFIDELTTASATGSVQNGCCSLRYDTAGSGLEEGVHTIYVKCMEGERAGAILAVVEIVLGSAEPVIAKYEFAGLPGDAYRHQAGRR